MPHARATSHAASGFRIRSPRRLADVDAWDCGPPVDADGYPVTQKMDEVRERLIDLEDLLVSPERLAGHLLLAHHVDDLGSLSTGW